MAQKYRNIYQIARKNTGLVQEKAAELLDLSVDSIRAYEGGKRIPTDEVIEKMVKVYKSPYLYYEHLKNTALGEKYLPDIESKDLAESVLTFLYEIDDIDNIKRTMLKLSKDNKIDENEQNDWDKVMDKIRDFVSAGMTLMFSKEGGIENGRYFIHN